MSHLRVAPDRAAELVSAFRSRAGLVDNARGFLGLEVWQSDRDPGELVMVSRWTDRACFRDYMRSEEHRISHARIPADLDEAIKLEELAHLHTYEIVAT
jgi:heme oxygenase (mycobilin-producing)